MYFQAGSTVLAMSVSWFDIWQLVMTLLNTMLLIVLIVLQFRRYRAETSAAIVAKTIVHDYANDVSMVCAAIPVPEPTRVNSYASIHDYANAVSVVHAAIPVPESTRVNSYASIVHDYANDVSTPILHSTESANAYASPLYDSVDA